MSAKRKLESRIYAKKRKAFLAEHPQCVVYPELLATDIHHKFGRGFLLMDERYWIGVSRRAHEKIHHDPNWARQNGLLAERGQWQNPPGYTKI